MMNSLLRRRVLIGQQEHYDWDSYIQDGLIFQLDCDTQCTEQHWIDIKGGMDFIGHNMQVTDKVIFYNGYYQADDVVSCDYDTSTLEIVLTAKNQNRHVFYTDSPVKPNLLLNIGTNNTFIFTTNYRYQCKGIEQNKFTVLSLNKDRQIVNGTQSEQGAYSRNNTFIPGATIIGVGTDYQYHFSGDIFAIRIYNRLLSEQEILINQNIDNIRFSNR